MAEHSVGKIYVELDLDPSRYMRGQQTLLKEAQNGAKILEKNFHNLNIKSDATYDLMRAQAEQSFMRIKKAHNTTVDDMVRAEKAKAEKIRQINEQQYGKQISMMHKFKSNYLAISASIAASLYVIQQATRPFVAAFEKGFNAVEDYAQSVAGLSAMVVTFTERAKGVSLSDQWERALKYSTAMVPILENIAAKTLLSGQETTALANAFARAGVFLNASNVKQVESFTRISNALPLMTKGQEIMRQINSEIRAVMTGANEATSMMLQTLKAIDPEIEKHLKTWRAEGTVLEHIGDLLVGFGPATTLLERQWQAVKSTIETTATQILRGLMKPAYDSIIQATIDLNEWLVKNKDTIINWGTSFRIALISVEAEIVRIAMLLDKVGGTLTTAQMFLYGPGSALGFESSEKRFEKAAEANMMYAERYAENDKRLEELAKKQIALEQELADTTVTAAQQKADASETFTAKTVVDIKAQAQALKDHAKEMKQAAKDAEHLKKALESIRVKLLQIEASNAWDVQNMSDWVRAGNQAIEDMEREFGIYMDGVYRDIENTDAKVVEDVRKTTDLTYDLWMRAMNRVEEGIADTFYEVFTGQFDSIEDAFDSMLDSMLRMLAEWAAAATMFDLFGKGDGSASWGGFFSSVFGSGGSTSGVWGNGSSGGGWMDWVGTLFSAGKSGYELYTGESLMGQVYNFAAESLASIFAEAAGGAYVGMYAEVTMAEVEAMVAAELAATEGIGAGASVGAGSAGAWVGGAYAAAAMALILGITAVFENNTMKNDANMTVAFGAKISELYNRLFDLEFLSVIFNDGFDQADAETEAMSLFNEIAGTFGAFEKIWSVLSEESQRELKESMKAINWDDFVITIQAVATANGEAQRIIGMMGSEGFKDWISAGMPKSDGKPWTEGDNKYDDYWDEFMHAGYPNSGMDYYAEAATATDILWDVIHEYFQPYLAEAVQGIMDFDVYQYMSDEFKTSVESLLTDEAWSNGVDAYFQTFSDNIDKIYAAAAAYDDFNNFIDGSTDKYTEQSRAIALATAATAAQVALLESMGHELSEEGIQELATMWAQYYANLSDDLSALAEPVTMLDQAVAAYTAQFETYWQQMIDAGIDVEKLGDKTQIFDDAVKDLIQTLQTAVWDEIEKSVKALNSEIGSTETAVTNLVSVFTEMWQALVQVNAASEDFVSLQQMALETMKYQMGLGDGFDRAGQIEDRYGRYGLSYQQMINAFANMDLDGLMAIAGELGIDWWDIADDVAWMIDQLEGAGEAATIAATDFTALRSSIEATLSGVSGSFGGSNSASMLMSQITGMQGIPMSEMTGDTLLSMSEKLVQWYNAAVSEAQAVANEENAAAQLLIQVSDRLESLVSQIDSTIRSIKFSTLNVAIPGVKAVEAQGDYNKLLAAAQSGGTSEINEYLGFAQTYLQQQQNAYKSSETYQGLYATVMADMEAIKSKAEAGGYDAQILAELQSGHETIDADLSGIQATFSEFEGWILNALTTLETLEMILTIDWANWDGDMADALQMLLDLVEVYGWDHEYTLKFLAEIPLDIFENLDQLASAAGWIADQSGGWNSTATISFLKNVAANWQFENVGEILTSIGYVAQASGGYGTTATVSFVTELMDRFGQTLADMPAWYTQMGLSDAETFDISVAVAASVASVNMYDDAGNLKTPAQMINWIMTEVAPYYPAEVTKAVGIQVLGDLLTLSMPSNVDTPAEMYAWLSGQLSGLVPADIQDTIIANILTTSLSNTMPSNLNTLAEISAWLTTSLRGVVPDSVADQAMARITMNLVAAGTIGMDSIAEINAYVSSLGIMDANISRTLRVNLTYEMVSSGDLDFKDVATYAYNQAYAAWIMAPGTPEAVSILYDLKALGQMWGSKNAYNLGTGVNLYGGYTSSIQSWMDLFNRHGVSGTGWKYGGMAYGPESGYYAQLHGNELIVSPKEGYPATVLSNGGSTQAGANRDQEVALLKEQNRLLRQIANQDLKIKGMNKYMRATAEDVDVERANRGKSASKERYVS